MLARLTAAKAITNIAHRWIAFFLPTLSRAFSATTGQMTLILGLGEMSGLVTLLVGRQLDKGRERATVLVALSLVAVGSYLAIVGSLLVFAPAYLIILVGVSLCTVGGHAYLSRRVLYNRRARVIGIFETSWASALLIGAPIAAVLIQRFSWRAPFVVFGFVAVIIAMILSRAEDHAELLDDVTGQNGRQPLTVDAWVVIAASAAIAITGLTTVVIAGTWLDDALGVSTAGVGLVAMAFGVAELTASSSSAAVADRVGPNRATRYALVLVMIGLGVMTTAGSSLVIGAVGLFAFFVGFEFAIVTSFSIVSEAMPSARGRVLAANNAMGTLFRGIGVGSSGLLYEAFGIAGPATLSAVSAVVAVALLFVNARRLNLVVAPQPA